MKMWRQRASLAALVVVTSGSWLALASGPQKTPAAQQATADTLLGTAQYQEQIEGKLEAAIATYRRVLSAADATRAQKARAQFRIGACYERLGLAEARKAYQAVVANYADLSDLVALAKARLAALAEPVGRNDTPVMRQVWTTAEGVNWNRISPDGRSVVGVHEGTSNLVVRNIATAETRQLITIPKDRVSKDFTGSPVWSRDGQQIAYRWSVDRTPAEFRIVDLADGTSRAVPMEVRFRPYSLEDWSPDGRRLLARLEEGSPENRVQHLAWVPTSSGPVELVASAEAGKRLSPAFLSPDGAWIVTRIPSDDTAFSIVAAGGGPPRPLIPAAASDALVGWSADGADVLFSSREGGFNDLMAVRVENSRAVARPFLVRTLQAFAPLGISETGALLYRSRLEPRGNLYRASLDATAGRVGPPSRVDVSEGQTNGSVSWSPDGRRLAYVSWPDDGPARTLSICSSESGQTRTFRLSFDAQKWGWRPTTWSADGRWVYVAGLDAADRAGLYRINAENGVEEVLLPPASDLFPMGQPTKNPYVMFAAWSPDARLVYKAELRWQGPIETVTTAVAAIVEHRLADHAERDLFTTGPPHQAKVGVVAVSPDGSQLAFTVVDYAARTITLLLVPAAGGSPKTLTALPTTAEGVVRWAHDGRSVVFSLRGDDPQGRFLCDVATGAVTKLALASDLVEEIAVSPDGKAIAYVGSHRRQDAGVWMLENFLPQPKVAAPAAKKTP